VARAAREIQQRTYLVSDLRMIAAGDCQAETQTSKAATDRACSAKAAAGSLRAGCFYGHVCAPFDALPLCQLSVSHCGRRASGGSIPIAAIARSRL